MERTGYPSTPAEDQGPILPNPEKVAENAAFKVSDSDDDDNDIGESSRQQVVNDLEHLEDGWRSHNEDSEIQRRVSYGDLKEENVWDR